MRRFHFMLPLVATVLSGWSVASFAWVRAGGALGEERLLTPNPLTTSEARLSTDKSPEALTGPAAMGEWTLSIGTGLHAEAGVFSYYSDVSGKSETHTRHLRRLELGALAKLGWSGVHWNLECVGGATTWGSFRYLSDQQDLASASGSRQELYSGVSKSRLAGFDMSYRIWPHALLGLRLIETVTALEFDAPYAIDLGDGAPYDANVTDEYSSTVLTSSSALLSIIIDI